MSSVIDLFNSLNSSGALGDTLAPTGSGNPNINLAIWSGLIGSVAPYLIAVINQLRWSANRKTAVTVAVAVGLGVVTTAIEGQLAADRLATSALLVLAAATASYKLLLKKSATALEAKTSAPVVDGETA